MSKNTHLYAEMENLIKFYNRKLSEDDGALYEILVNLVNSDKEISCRYAAVSIRNEYIKLSKAEHKRACVFRELVDIYGAFEPDFDIKIDLKTALSKLSEVQRNCILARYFWGFSAVEIAALYGVSRQSVNRALKRALDKLKTLL